MLKAARKEVEKSAKSAEAWAADCLDMFGTWENHGKTMGKPWENGDLYEKSPLYSWVNQVFLWAMFKFANS
jgi:hypothetical protein